ncbi:MAG: carboxypeptidase-like regulatory domain-containing protein, partial [Bacteroidales bacterium]
MKTKLPAICIAVWIAFMTVSGQQITQTVRGTVKDEDGKFALIGATVIISGTNPVKGAVCDNNGEFRLDKVPVGRIDLEIKFIGYEDLVIPNVLVSSGKETLLDLEMRESFVKVDEIVVTAQKEKGEVLNEMAVISSRAFSVEETKRYAGALQDPSRMVSAFAGVTGNPDGSNDIIVR